MCLVAHVHVCEADSCSLSLSTFPAAHALTVTFLFSAFSFIDFFFFQLEKRLVRSRCSSVPQEEAGEAALRTLTGQPWMLSIITHF